MMQSEYMLSLLKFKWKITFLVKKKMFFACFESFTRIYLSIRVDNDFLIKFLVI